MALDAVLSLIDESELIALTCDLIRIPSVFSPGDPRTGEAAVAQLVARWLGKEGLAVETVEVAPGRPNVVAWHGPRGGRTLLLEGHTDVVTEGDPGEWRYPPFAADVVDGRIHGRGAADMKGGLAAAMVAAAALRRSGVPLGGCLVVGAFVDEEGDMLGVRHFCTTGLARELGAAIICEPEQNELCLEQRGVVWARVTLRGRMAHGAMPEAGRNPIGAVGDLLTRVGALERRLRRASRRSRHLRPPTVTPTVIEAPLHGLRQPNVIPSSAAVTLDIRLMPGPDAARVMVEIDRLCEDAGRRHPGVSVDWQPVNGFRMPTRVAANEPLVRAMTAAVRRVTGRKPVYGGVPGTTDGTILRSELGIPIVTCGPGNRLIPHQVNEYVDIQELVEAAKIYAASALTFLQP